MARLPLVSGGGTMFALRAAQWRGKVQRPPSLDDVLARRIREKSRPEPKDDAFLHLLDLRAALRDALAGATGTWLDLGAGTSPYAELFAEAELKRADLADSEHYAVDYELDDSGRCAAPDGRFDGVLSTQVLEHVTDPGAYLAEAYRLLRPGGRLVLSTHGVWEDHLAQDLWRWTADGLAKQVEAAGFRVHRTQKLTCGARALLLLLLRYCRDPVWTTGGRTGLFLGLSRLLDRLFPTWFNEYAQRCFSAQGRAQGAEEWFYIAVLVQASRPEAGSDGTQTRLEEA